MAEQTLEGMLDIITYQNPENHFLIGRFLPGGQTKPVTIKGTLFNVFEGQTLRLWGDWEEHRDYGRQFAVTAFLSVEPTTLEGIERYLASGVIKGVGKAIAKNIVKTFGQETFRVIDDSPERLKEVPKFPAKALESVKKAWKEQEAIRDIMVYLHSQGISQAYADRIYTTYGFTSVEVIKENPYRLAMDVRGIGFRIADAIAERMGIARDSPQRAEAGVLYMMEEIAGEGHTGLPRSLMMKRAAKLLEVGPSVVELAVETLVGDGLLRSLPPQSGEVAGAVKEGVSESVNKGNTGEDFLSRPRLFKAEGAIVRHLGRIMASEAATRFTEIDPAIKRLEGETGLVLAPGQREAVLESLLHKVMVITGGPGTGKTTIIRFVLGLVSSSLPNLALAAPTGRAAKRLAEATGRGASTIHRLLESGQKGFDRNRDNPIDAELVIVDEASMIDTQLMASLLEAIPDHARLVLVGDVDQLPSVGPGMVLGDLIASGVVPVARLEHIFRQAELSMITSNAHAIRRGVMPDLSRPPGEELVDFYFMLETQPERIVEKILTMVTARIPERFGLDPLREVQVLTPMHKGLTGAQNLNRELQQALNPLGEEVRMGDNLYRIGDKVMQTRNDYEKEVFNGDMGQILEFDHDGGMASILFDEREVIYEKKEMEALTLGYAITVHKSQGSEYPAVVLPLTSQHAIMLQRNLLYTAITRARRLVVLVGSEQAVGMAVRNARPDQRHTRLRQRLVTGEPELVEAAG